MGTPLEDMAAKQVRDLDDKVRNLSSEVAQLEKMKQGKLDEISALVKKEEDLNAKIESLNSEVLDALAKVEDHRKSVQDSLDAQAKDIEDKLTVNSQKVKEVAESIAQNQDRLGKIHDQKEGIKAYIKSVEQDFYAKFEGILGELEGI